MEKRLIMALKLAQHLLGKRLTTRMYIHDNCLVKQTKMNHPSLR